MYPTRSLLRLLLPLAASYLTLSGCAARSGEDAGRPASGIESRPLAAASSGGAKLFHGLSPDETGIDFVNVLERHHNLPFLNTGAGVAIGDYDGDGAPDLYLVSTDGPNRLYRQTAPLVFEDVTAAAGVDGGDAWSRGAVFADVDNDGDLDLYVCNTEAPNLLYLNLGDGRFTEGARSMGLDHAAASIMAYFADYDRDGDLDMYLVTYRVLKQNVTDGQVADIELPANTVKTLDEIQVQGVRAERRDGKLVSLDQEQWVDLGTEDWELAGQRDKLFRNNGNGTFSDVTEDAGLTDYGLGLSAAWLDFDDDGWLDLHVSNDLTTRDRLYKNNGDGTFTNVLPKTLPHTTWYSMGSDVGDVDNDGLFDLLVADMAGSNHYRAKVGMGDMSSQRYFLTHEWPRQLMRNSLYINTGTERFMEVAFLAGLAATDWTWAVRFGDLDNDGRIDLFLTNGAPRDDMNIDVMGIKFLEIEQEQGEDAALEYLKTIPPSPTPNLAFRNDGDFHFEEMGEAWGLDHNGVSFGAAYSDLDRDGDLDLVVNHLNEPAGIYRNDSNAGHRVLVRAVGEGSNRFGIGAKITVQSKTLGTQIRQLLPARGFMSADEPVVHFGLGDDEVITRLEVEWPSGHRQSFEELAADHLHTVYEPTGEVEKESTEAPAAQPPQFEEIAEDAGLTWRHLELDFDDYELQELLPSKLSQLGPGAAWGDVDGDGDDDLFLAAARRQPGRLYMNRGDGTFERRREGAFRDHSLSEDMAPLFFDADGDGDLDLFVTSGSVESEPGDGTLRDRLYLNDGQGLFAPASDGALPRSASSNAAVAAADFDADGDLDLFVGGRTIAGKYPQTPDSQLLLNTNGHFEDVSDDLAPGLRRAGMVTSALWSDADDDGRPDLFVTVEWGPVRYFRNNGEGLEEQTEEAGLADRLGWWNSITGGDWNSDGHIDYAVMNNGLNSKYKASSEKPAQLFYGDMDGSGTAQLIEAKTASEGLLPVRGRSCSAHAMPFVEEKFPTFHEFASAVLPEIYEPEILEEAGQWQATELASGVLLNDGRGAFTWQALPRLAQAAPGFGAAAGDFDGDGHLDLYAVQNFFTREPETGPLDGGLSVFLRGDGTGALDLVSPAESGLVVPGDAMGLAVADLDRDAWPDFLITRNDDTVMLFKNRGVEGRRPLAVRLVGPPGNPTAAGARLRLITSGGRVTAAEVYAGSGYLSQSAPTLFFGLDPDDPPAAIEVRWPDGELSTHTPDPSGGHVRIDHPSAVPVAAAEEPRGPPAGGSTPGHAKMLALLSEIRDRAAEHNVYVGTAEASELRRKLATTPETAPPLVRLEALAELADAVLKLGEEKDAVGYYTEALELASQVPGFSPQRATRLKYDLAIAWLRLGETENCIQHTGQEHGDEGHANPDSCILPIRGRGVHERQEGARQAIGRFEQVLGETTPSSRLHLDALWLLNVAYMTIGEYPDAVPAAHRISPAALASDEEIPRFVNIAPRLGLDTFSLAGGAVAEDFDNDDDLDLLVSTADPGGQIRFFTNDGGKFTDRTLEAGLTGLFGGLNLVQADYDNDGDVDVLVLRGAWNFLDGRHPNSLLRNNGGGADGIVTFHDVTFEAGLGERHYPTQTASWADYDNDGHLDLYIGNESFGDVFYPSELFHNNGGGADGMVTFTEVSKAAGVENDAFTKAVIWGDYDGDTWSDLYVSNYSGRNRLYRNNGDGTFKDVARDLGVDLPIESFPAWFWDFDNDGVLDLYVSAYSAAAGTGGALAATYLGRPPAGDAPRARLYRGDGRGGFEDVAARSRLDRPSAPMGANFGDLDNDGFLDVYLGTGWPEFDSLMPSVMYRNRGGRDFADVTTAGGLGHLQKGHAVVFADFDHDGDQDIFEQMGGFYLGDQFNDVLYENPGFGRHWIALDLVGVRSNRSAIGARIRIDLEEDGVARTIHRVVNSGGTFGANPLRQSIGLGTATAIEHLEVFWPASGTTQAFSSLPVDRLLRIVEDEELYIEVELPRAPGGQG